MISEWIAIGCITTGAFFYLAGTVGLLRFPDLYSRLHAVTKADNLGLGWIVLGLLVYSGDVLTGLKLILIWLLALLSGSTACFLIAQAERSGQGERSVPDDG
jgi:multicomponent Na+:H+ antiporter subunit G